MDGPVLIKGAGELASGIAWRLFRSGFPVVLTEVPQPLAVRRAVSFCEAVHDGEATVEGVTARLVPDVLTARVALGWGVIPLLVDPSAACLAELQPRAVVDAIMAKRNLGTTLTDAPLVIGVGPGFTASHDCHAVVETQRGHWLGRVYYEGGAIPDTGVPALRAGHDQDRILRAPADGNFRDAGLRRIGDLVEPGDRLGDVAGEPVTTGISGVLRGLIRDGTPVTRGMKIGDVDPVAEVERCFTISDKALAVAGGVLEALLVLARLAE
jgi:xanthine dehydrogenase accessory factor